MGFDFLDFGFPRSGTDWKSINGKPSITVSAKGRSNGLSNKINDGADFGPDTTLNATSPSQTGPPYSPTLGILEAIKYVDSNGYGGTVLLKRGLYVISQSVQYQFNTSIAIIGEAMGSGVTKSTQKYVTGVMIMPSESFPAGNYLFDLDNTSSQENTGMLYIDQIEFFGSYSLTNPIGNSTYLIASGLRTGHVNHGPARQFIGHIRTVSCLGSTTTNIPSIDINNAGGPTYIQLIQQTYSSNPTFNAIDLTMEHYECYIQQGFYGINFNGSLNPTPYYSHYNIGTIYMDSTPTGALNVGDDGYPVNINIDKVIYDTSATNNNGVRIFTFHASSVVNTNNIVLFGSQPNSSNNNLFTLANVGTSTLLINAVIKNITWYVALNTGTPTISGSMVLYGGTTTWNGSLTIDNFVIEPTGAVFTATLPNVISNVNIFLRNPTSYISVLGQPTTPTVPASGTAVQNTNPYATNVYLYGGTVTEIQLTRNGTAYTVFSNASGLALSGQVYKLNPSDEITLTYTTAPTWEWLSD